MNRVWQGVLVAVGALLTGATLFVISFLVVDFVWTHLVLTDPKKLGMSDGVVVIGGGFPDRNYDRIVGDWAPGIQILAAES